MCSLMGIRKASAKRRAVMESDLDSVLENLSLLINGMEDTKIKEKQPKKYPPRASLKQYTIIKPKPKDDVQEDEMYLSVPSIQLDYESRHHKYIDTTFNNLDDKMTIKDNYDESKRHEENVKRAREIIKSLNTSDDIMKSCLKKQTQRLYLSANNSPHCSPDNSRPNSAHGGLTRALSENDKTQYKISSLANSAMDKYDVSLECPDGQDFKAGVYKYWTACQLVWKIAHVKGMVEKLALNIQEKITDLHLVRNLEDHENVYSVIQNWAPQSNNVLKMTEDPSKYDLFNEPADYIPVELFKKSIPADFDKQRYRRSSFLRSITTFDLTPIVNGWIFVKDFDKKQWHKKYVQMSDCSIYLSDKKENIESKENLIYDCNTSVLYTCLPEFNNAHGTPTPYCFCIIPNVVSDWHEIKCFCVDSKRLLTGWISGFRLVKNGQRLYFNFREAMNKEANLLRANSSRQSTLFRRSLGNEVIINTTDNKAPIDFSGANGRIISDPSEVQRVQNEIGLGIPKNVKRKSGAFSPAVARQSMLENKSWFHGKLNREQAVQNMKKHGLKEGMFLVRESSSTHGGLVLSVVTKKMKITHHQIFQSSSHSGVSLYGIENGPQFSSLETLIDSYRSGAVEGADFCLKKPFPI